MKSLTLPFMIFALSIQACGPQQSSDLQSAWDPFNDPERMGSWSLSGEKTYIRQWSELPLQAALETTPWSDDYWPTHKGGLGYRWNAGDGDSEESQYAYELKDAGSIKKEDTAALSPIEKLDLVLGRRDFFHTRAERKRTQILRTVASSELYEEGFEIPTWEGLCHAWAPATLLFEEPAAVTIDGPGGLGIEFGSSDIKALLTYFLHSVPSPRQSLLGLRCEEDFAALDLQVKEGSLSKREAKRRKNAAACFDTNAGAFHLVLANQIGRLKEGFIIDITRDQEVWNQPVYAYESKVLRELDRASPGAAAGTQREVTLETTMHYVQEVSQDWEHGQKEEALTHKVYRYRLELDAGGQIIGGAWLSSERPDFLWKIGQPEFEGEFRAIEKIYKASIEAKQKSEIDRATQFTDF